MNDIDKRVRHLALLAALVAVLLFAWGGWFDLTQPPTAAAAATPNWTATYVIQQAKKALTWTPTPTPAPVAPSILSPRNRDIVETGEIAISGKGQPGASVDILDNGRLRATTNVDDRGSWSVPLRFDSAGEHRLTVRTSLSAEEILPGVAEVALTVETPSPTPCPAGQGVAEGICVPHTPTPTATPIPPPPPTPTPTPCPTGQVAVDQGCALPTPSPTATPTPLPTLEVLTSGLNIRSGPGIDYKVLDNAERGATYTILGQAFSCTWLNVAGEGILSGWVSGSPQYVKFDQVCAEIPLGVYTPLPTLAPTRATATFTPAPTPTVTTEPPSTSQPTIVVPDGATGPSPDNQDPISVPD